VNIILEISIACLVTGIAVWFDYRERRIPNQLVFTGMIAGLVIGMISGGVKGLAWSALGLLAGIGILFVPFAMGGMGAGDVKLLGAIGAILGARGALFSMLYGAIAGGLISVIILARHGRLGPFLISILAWLARFVGYLVPGSIGRSLRTIHHTKSSSHLPMSGLSIPYSVAIAIGLIIAVFTDFRVISL
jgi:prepilin peptidase CpaA